MQVLDELAAAQLQHRAIEKEIADQRARVDSAVSELDSLKVSSAEMQRQLEYEAQAAELALLDLRQRYSNSQSELASVQLEVNETLDIARRKAERAAAFR